MAALAAVAGFVDFFGEHRIRQLSAAWHHVTGNWHRRHEAGDAAVLPIGIMISLAVHDSLIVPQSAINIAASALRARFRSVTQQEVQLTLKPKGLLGS